MILKAKAEEKHKPNAISSRTQRNKPAPQKEEEFVLSPDLANALGFWLRSAVLVADKMFTTTFASEQITPGLYAILMSVDTNPGCKTSDLCQLMGVSPNNMVPYIDDLVGRGFLRRELGIRDRRIRPLYLTDAGVTYAKKLRQQHEDVQEQIKTKLGDEELDSLLRLLKIYSADLLTPPLSYLP